MRILITVLELGIAAAFAAAIAAYVAHGALQLVNLAA